MYERSLAPPSGGHALTEETAVRFCQSVEMVYALLKQRQEQPARLLLTMKEAASVLGVGLTLMYALVGQETITSVKVGRRRMVPVRALERYVEALEESTCPDAAMEKAPSLSAKMVAGRRA